MTADTEANIMGGEKDFVADGKGRGGESKQEVVDYFKTFGATLDEGDAVTGGFRIGRGHVMSLGRVTWTVNGFKMVVDVKTDELSFKYSESDGVLSGGCKMAGTF